MIDMGKEHTRMVLAREWDKLWPSAFSSRDLYNDAWWRVKEHSMSNYELTGVVLCALAIVKVRPC